MNIYLHNKVVIPNVLKNLEKDCPKGVVGVGWKSQAPGIEHQILRSVECILADTGGDVKAR